jgi:alpha-L-fucosidase
MNFESPVESLKDYKCPEWFRDAKFGIWAHWGAQSVPHQGCGWYARHMYVQPSKLGHRTWGAPSWPYHRKTYGHQSEFGFKDVCNLWHAEKYDPAAMIGEWKKWGARYAAIMCNHHDRFDNWDSSAFYEWNSVKVGPHRDIVADFVEAVHANDLPWVATVHDVSYIMGDWYKAAFDSDEEGPKKCVPYDGWLTREDGKGKWWDGLDPRNLYGVPESEQTDEWVQEMTDRWYARHSDLLLRYQPDALYFDSPDIPFGETGMKLCSNYCQMDRGQYGKGHAIVQVKRPAEGVMYDVERGGADDIRPEPWQTDTTLAENWFLRDGYPHPHNARTLIESLCDIVSKNGNMLLNLGLRADGTLPDDQRKVMEEIGDWLKANGEAIYYTRPWKVFRDGSGLENQVSDERSLDNVDEAVVAEAQRAQLAHFNERTLTSPHFCADEVRFTCKDKSLFVHVMNPKPGTISIPALGLESDTKPGHFVSATVLMNNSRVDFAQEKDCLKMILPEGILQGMPLVVELAFE